MGAVVDWAALERYQARLHQRKAAERPLFWPVLCLVSRRKFPDLRPYWGELVDEVAALPLEPAELQARLRFLEQVREHTRALRRRQCELEAFFRGVAHDLRAPLRIIDGYVEALREDLGPLLKPEADRFLERIRASAHQLRVLVDRLYAFCQLGFKEPTALRPIQVRPVLEQTLAAHREVAAARRAEFSVLGPDAWVWGDTSLLRTGASELLRNALTYVSPGLAPWVRITVQPGPRWVRIAFEDNGIGVPPEHQERIFEPLVRLHGPEAYPGTGMGLAIARKAVELMGGRIGLQAGPTQGSVFWIELLRAEADGSRGAHEDLDYRR
ncbi:MAG: HAMP domain-containing histidine kinase [Bacteroidetes bacterium]|nr:HAMP domain-containing histidine kinase [Rhodothermia bacterium]MCS7154730.1 HAMP domain-containing histidine kinase [Bacteroidota bacterium]MCX7907113.1 HAMP domain-containing histidine kinase [Bacteroidota bacterium]MDW8137523.1 HAMP domain-containing sensor histidine kinase [Bacteroidota bacterium]MDW8285523.1 HAMP domain-containing sensor histidine kinase [Bacteroidota bacterium]